LMFLVQLRIAPQNPKTPYSIQSKTILKYLIII